MRRGALYAALGFFALLALVWALRPKQKLDDETLIRQVVSAVAAAAGQKDVAGVLKHVSDRYKGDEGGKDDLRRVLAGAFIVSGVVAAFATDVRVTVAGDQADASLTAIMARTPASSAAEVKAEGLVGSQQITCKLAREDGAWRVVEAHRTGGGPSPGF